MEGKVARLSRDGGGGDPHVLDVPYKVFRVGHLPFIRTISNFLVGEGLAPPENVSITQNVNSTRRCSLRFCRSISRNPTLTGGASPSPTDCFLDFTI